MWFNYCGASSDRVVVDAFFVAVGNYLEEQLGFCPEETAAMLSAENREALTCAINKDANGEVLLVGPNFQVNLWASDAASAEQSRLCYRSAVDLCV